MVKNNTKMILTLSAILGGMAFSAIISGALADDDDPFKASEHFKIERPSQLEASDADAIYDNILKQMSDGYAQSGDVTAKKYKNWRRENNAPYLSAGHGNRYLSNYSNNIARNYLELRRGEKMPVGSILAKDSFTATDGDDIYAGALFIMEKLAEGVSNKTGDWRYAMIMPDGSVFGDSAIAGDESMKFCHDCHDRVKNRDYLFLIPQQYRRSDSN